MTRLSRLSIIPIAFAWLHGCSEPPPPEQTQTPFATQAQPAAGDGMKAPEVPSSVTAEATQSHSPKPTGPHGQQDPHSQLDPERLIKVALQHDREGRYELALKTLAEGISRFPDAAELYAVRASLRLQNQQTSMALADLEKAVALAPDDARIRVNRAQAYRAFGRFEEALEDLNIAIDKEPDLIPARFNRGALLYAESKFDQALLDFEHCIAIDPHTPAPYFNRASTFWELGRSDEAMADLERFLELVDDAEWKQAAEDLLKNWRTVLENEAKGVKSSS